MVVDIFMPHMRGFESMRVFHERAPSIPLIAMSGFAFANVDAPARIFSGWRSNSARRGVCAKPFAPAVLISLINECVAESQMRAAGAARSLW